MEIEKKYGSNLIEKKNLWRMNLKKSKKQSQTE